VSNVFLEADDETTATVVCYVTSLVVRGDTPVLVSAGWCRDHVQLDGGTWRFVERQMSFDAVPG